MTNSWKKNFNKDIRVWLILFHHLNINLVSVLRINLVSLFPVIKATQSPCFRNLLLFYFNMCLLLTTKLVLYMVVRNLYWVDLSVIAWHALNNGICYESLKILLNGNQNQTIKEGQTIQWTNEKGQTMSCKTPHRKQTRTPLKPCVNPGALEWQPVPALHLAPVVM